MGIAKNTLRIILEKSLDEFFKYELENILAGISERNMCGRLALYLEKISKENSLTEYFADTEYNRKQNREIKTILSGEYKVIQITADLILHSRGLSKTQDNLIAIEMKKTNGNKETMEKDHERLQCMTKKSFDGIWSNDGKTHPEHVCGYIFGVYMELDIGNRLCYFTIYEDGIKTKDFIRKF